MVSATDETDEKKVKWSFRRQNEKQTRKMSSFLQFYSIIIKIDETWLSQKGPSGLQTRKDSHQQELAILIELRTASKTCVKSWVRKAEKAVPR